MNAPSRRTIVIGIAGLALVAALWGSMSLLEPESQAFLAMSDLGETAVIAVAAVTILLSAARMDTGPFRTRWLLIGAGVSAYAVGDAVWSFIELVKRSEVPYPGVPDLFYLLEYALLAIAIMGAGLAYRRIIDIRRPAVLAGTATIVGAVALWLSFIAPLARDTESALGERVLNVFYPMADVLLLAGPALFTILVVARLGTGRLGRPWWPVAVGALVLASSDTAFSWMSASDTYRPGTVVDVGWMLAHVAIAVGALTALDLAKPAD